MIRTLIVDDEPLAREGIAVLLQKDPVISVVGECKNGQEALKMLSHRDIDLLFIDIQMPGMSGFDVLAQVPHDRMPAVIFVTAYDEYALRAFKVHALDYLLKPYTDKEFFSALHRAKQYIQLKSLEPLTDKLAALLHDHDVRQAQGKKSAPSAEYINHIAVQSRERITPLNVEDIDWIEAADDYLQLHQGPKSHLVRDTLTNLEAKLDPEKFVRIHRSIIVRINAIKELRPFFGGDAVVILHSGTELKLGRTYRQKIKKLMYFPS